MVLDFTEIPPANGVDGQQDIFELFARDYLENIGFEIVSGPDRGADGGRDILAIEKRLGKFSSTDVKWLVSCNHKAHTGQSVKPNDEKDIIDRINQFGANGFIGFYSTIVSSGLSDRLESYKNDYEIEILDQAKIEKELLKPENFDIAKRYFPVSSKKWYDNNKPAKVFSTYEPLLCEVCHKDLLIEDGNKKPSGIIAFVNRNIDREKELDAPDEHVLDVYAACKGRCDRTLEHYWLQKGGTTGWKDITDLVSPLEFLSWNMSILNELRNNKVIYEDKAFKKLKLHILSLAQLVVREVTPEELERYKVLQSLPPWI